MGQNSDSLALSTETKEWQLSIRPIATQKLSFVEKCGKLWQKWRGAAQQISKIVPCAPSDGELVQSPASLTQAIAIQGVASSLVHRRLVLIASGNQILDILTVEQQQQLYQRIIFEIAVALSVRRRLGTSSTALPLQHTPLALLKGAWRQIQQSARSIFLPPSADILLLSESQDFCVAFED